MAVVAAAGLPRTHYKVYEPHLKDRGLTLAPGRGPSSTQDCSPQALTIVRVLEAGIQVVLLFFVIVQVHTVLSCPLQQPLACTLTTAPVLPGTMGRR